MAAVTNRFELSEVQSDKITLESHLLNYWRQSGVMPEQLDTKPIPFEIAHVWSWWLELRQTRQIGMAACHITYTEVFSWAALLNIKLLPFEVRCLMAIDTACLECSKVAEEARAAQPSTKE